MTQARTPLVDTAQPFLRAAEHFNHTLFEGQLPTHTVSLQRHMRALSLFLPSRWRKTTGSTMHEVALNPALFAERPLLMILQAIVQGQCHLWQHTYGSPSRAGYHNSEWSSKMETLGFTVSAPGAPHRKTGQHVVVTPVARGPFVASCVEWIEHGSAIDWLDQGFVRSEINVLSLTGAHLRAATRRHLLLPVCDGFQRLVSVINTDHAKRKRKVCYRCPRCQTSVWGKEGLALKCLQCSARYAVVPAALRRPQRQHERTSSLG